MWDVQGPCTTHEQTSAYFSELESMSKPKDSFPHVSQNIVGFARNEFRKRSRMLQESCNVEV